MNPPSLQGKLLSICFVSVLVTWVSFANIARESRTGALIMLETHVTISSLIFHLILILVLRLISFMDLNIAHMVLAPERTTLCPNALVTTHILIVVIVSHITMVFLLEGLPLTLSSDTWMVHVFPVVVLILMVQRVRCKRP
jgi:hypothetical protein